MNALTFTSPFELIPGDPARGIVLVADHAKRALPLAKPRSRDVRSTRGREKEEGTKGQDRKELHIVR